MAPSMRLMTLATRAAIIVAAGTILLSAVSCDQNGKSQPPTPPGDPKPADGPKADPKPANPTLAVPISGRTFTLELALTDKVRMKGLGQRDSISPDGGMLFCFRASEIRSFVMRDCPIPIDIIYLDGAGRILSFYEMKPEAPRAEDEKKLEAPYPGAPDWQWVNPKYEARISKTAYSSRFPAQFVIELKGGTIPGLDLKAGQKIDADWAALKKRAE